ncbi:Fc receptor-like protein 3 isoform X2 [Archocentrus centrarchus]|uniref:Fc receptor-like protein 3 isoform X2 n=1 Tax=Archocentrus centrarchus TaxID=63155 RepID=UPI0011EA1A8D|nr:Fc receptor-like protein 3 isoform X2 [Archocentrus centrarchus]
MLDSFFVIILGLCCCCRTQSSQFFLGHPRLDGPKEALVKSIAEFQCEVPNHPMDEKVLLQIFKLGDYSRTLGVYTSIEGKVGNIPMKVKMQHEGNLVCKASIQNTSISGINATFSNIHYFKVIEPVKGAQIIPSGLVELFEESTLELRCELSAGNHVSYKWLHNDQLISPSSSHRVSDNQLTISRVTSKDSGSYMCVATNVFNQTVFNARSSEVEITVKDLVSAPDISFTVLKEAPHKYSARVRCQSTQGAPPITFSLYNGSHQITNVTVDERHAELKLPLVLNRHMGDLCCHASNGEPTTYSRRLPLHVVPVGGPVTIESKYDSGENYAIIGLRFYCKADKGSHPRYQWFLNKTLLQDQGSFYYVMDLPPKQSMLALSVGRSSAGTYHCEVSDNFDNTTAISSKRRYIDKEVLNRIPDYVVGIVFGSFAFLIFLVSACCCIGVIFRKRQYGEKSLWSLQTQRHKAAYEDELDLSGYSDNPDLLKVVKMDEFDQAFCGK